MVLAVLIGGLARSLVLAAGVYLISLVFVQFPLAHPLLILYFLIFVSLLFSSLGMIVALFAEEFEHLTMATTFVITPLVFLGGVFHSVSQMPEPVRWIAQFNPIFYMVSGMRFAMLGSGEVAVISSIALVFLLFLALFSATVFLFKIGFKLRK
jgi:ABC-2 type transport system permease protein